jgi:polygalacturonase
MKSCNNSVVEHILLKNSPYWTLSTQKSDHVTIRYTNVDVRRTRYDGHDRIDMSAFNTDGFDVSGEYVHIHDCDIWNQDDCIAVKEVRASESD